MRLSLSALSPPRSQVILITTEEEALLWAEGCGYVPPSPVDESGEHSAAGLRTELLRLGLPLGELAGPEERKAEILAKLAEIDAASIRPLRAIAEDTATVTGRNSRSWMPRRRLCASSLRNWGRLSKVTDSHLKWISLWGSRPPRTGYRRKK